MPRTNCRWHGALGGWVVVCGVVMAQPQPAGRTVQELIQSLKAQRESQLDPQVQTPRESTSRPLAKGHPSMPPLLWSVSGLNGRFTAVMVVDRKVHEIQSQTLPVWVGGWRVRSIDEQGVGLTRGEKKLSLPAPSGNSTTDAFLKALPFEARQGDALMDVTAQEATMAHSAAPVSMQMPPPEMVTQTQQLAAPLPVLERMNTAAEVVAPPVPKEKR